MENSIDGVSLLARKTNRRKALKSFGLGALGLASVGTLTQFGSTANAATVLSLDREDLDILNFLLNLEYLEAEYYSYATTGAGFEAQGVGVSGQGALGPVIIKANPQVPFVTPAIQQYANEIATNEVQHVHYLRSILGLNAVARPMIDLAGSFTVAAMAAGVTPPGQTFDPFVNETSFLLGAFIFEDVGVTAYRGAAPFLANRAALSGAAGLLGTEAYHAAMIRTKIFEAGPLAQTAAQQISDLRDTLDRTGDDDQGVVVDGNANIAPTDSNGLVFARTAAQVLSIVYLSSTATRGGFFPNGVNADRAHGRTLF